MFALEKYIHAGSLGEALPALVKIHASQIDGCAYCLDMHGCEARAALSAASMCYRQGGGAELVVRATSG